MAELTYICFWSRLNGAYSFAVRLAAVCGLVLACVSDVCADEIPARMAFWESKAFSCSDAGAPFPSKETPGGEGQSSTCDAGDMTFFNGLLCAAGESRGCDGVKRAQGPDGRWWRSPAHIGKEATSGTYDVSFSPDMARGVLLYAVETNDVAAFRSWVQWIDKARPCVVKVGGTCLLQGWPRLCTDDVKDKRCTFRPTTCNDLELVGKRLGVPEADICRRVLKTFQIRDDYIIPTTELAAGSAVVNESGYPMHLAGAEIFMIDKLGLTSVYSRAGAVALALREPMNPFFMYLAEGPTQKVKDLVLQLCPTPEKPSRVRHQWAWEREAAEKAWEESMYWDCYFMGKLLGY